MAHRADAEHGRRRAGRRGPAPARRTRGCRSPASLSSAPKCSNVPASGSAPSELLAAGEHPGQRAAAGADHARAAWAQSGARSVRASTAAPAIKPTASDALEQPGPGLEDRRQRRGRQQRGRRRPRGRVCRRPVIGDLLPSSVRRPSRPSPPARRSPASRGRPAARARAAWRRARRRPTRQPLRSSASAAALVRRGRPRRGCRGGRLSQVELSISERRCRWRRCRAARRAAPPRPAVSAPNTRDHQAAVGAPPDPLDQAGDVAVLGQLHVGQVVEQDALAAALGGVDVDPGAGDQAQLVAGVAQVHRDAGGRRDRPLEAGRRALAAVARRAGCRARPWPGSPTAAPRGAPSARRCARSSASAPGAGRRRAGTPGSRRRPRRARPPSGRGCRRCPRTRRPAGPSAAAPPAGSR